MVAPLRRFSGRLEDRLWIHGRSILVFPCPSVSLPLRVEVGGRSAGPLYQDGGLVFASGHGKPLDAQNVVNRYYKPLLERASIPPIRFHDLRHSCLSLLAQRGEPIRDLQALAGHATAAFTLQRYTHHYDASAKRTADVMGSILPDDS